MRSMNAVRQRSKVVGSEWAGSHVARWRCQSSVSCEQQVRSRPLESPHMTRRRMTFRNVAQLWVATTLNAAVTPKSSGHKDDCVNKTKPGLDWMPCRQYIRRMACSLSRQSSSPSLYRCDRINSKKMKTEFTCILRVWLPNKFALVLTHFNTIFSERELTFAICYRPSVRLSVCLSSVCNARAPYSGGWNFQAIFLRH